MSATRLIGERDPGHGSAERKVRLRRLAWFAAILLHLAVPSALLVPKLLGLLSPRPPSAPAGIPVTLVMLPKEPDPAPQAKPPPPRYRESGPDMETAGPPPPPPAPPTEQPKPAPPTPEAPPAEQPTPQTTETPAAPATEQLATREAQAPAPQPSAPAAAPPEEPPPEPAPTNLPEVTLPTAPVPELLPTPPAKKPPPPAKADEPKNPVKEAKEPARAKEPAPPRPPTRTALAQHPPPRPPTPTRLEAPVSKSGDPYINRLRDEMEKHRFYPTLARGLELTGTVEFDMQIDRSGNLVALRIRSSSGTDLIDQAVIKMVRDSAPFPPPPADIPGDGIVVTGQITLVPP